jgi:P27 family predicted phage terminase small subunit
MNPPSWLSRKAKLVWKRLVPKLEAAGVLDPVDSSVLPMFCQTFARWREAENALSDAGLVIKGRDGGDVLNPVARYSASCLKQLNALLPRLGLDPKSRGNILKRIVDDDFQKFLDGRSSPETRAADKSAKDNLNSGGDQQ